MRREEIKIRILIQTKYLIIIQILYYFTNNIHIMPLICSANNCDITNTNNYIHIMYMGYDILIIFLDL